MKTYIGEIDYPNEALACEENKDAFILSIGFEAPPQTKMAISELFFGPIEPRKFDFSYKPVRMHIIAFWGLKNGKKGVSIAFLLSALTNF